MGTPKKVDGAVSFLTSKRLSGLSKISPYLMAPECSLPYSQNHATVSNLNNMNLPINCQYRAERNFTLPVQ